MKPRRAAPEAINPGLRWEASHAKVSRFNYKPKL